MTATERRSERQKRVPFAFVSPEGKLFTGTGIRAFAREHGLDQANMHRVHSGEKLQYKGWRVAE